jgi:hypothetical protein
MSDTFTGTVTVGVEVFSVTAQLSINNLKIVGSVVFDDDTNLMFLADFLLDAPKTSYTTGSSVWFTDPDARAIELLNLTIGETTVDTGFTALTIAAADCAIDAVPDTLSMSLAIVVDAVDLGGVEDIAVAEASLVRRSINPIRINEVGNQLDHFGAIVSLERLPEEENKDFNERIRHAVAKLANSTYEGMVNGTARELGLSNTDAIRVLMKDSPAGDEDKIRLFLNENEIIIYTDWMPLELQEDGAVPVVEQQTSLEDMTIGALVDWINLSGNYEATLLAQSTASATFLAVADSLLLVTEEAPDQEIIKFSSDNIIPGSITFQPTVELEVELEALSVPATSGEYVVDYPDGILTAYSQPGEEVAFTYTTNRRDFVLLHSPVKLTDISSEGGQDLLFNQVTREFYTSEVNHYVNGLPTNKMYGIMRDVLTAGDFPQFWGE